MHNIGWGDLLNKLTPSIVASILVCLASMSAGFLFLYVYFPTIFASTDHFKLTIVGIGITLPLILLNAYLYANTQQTTGKTNFAADIGMGALTALFILYCSIAVGFFLSNHSKKIGVSVVLGLEIILFFILFYPLSLKKMKQLIEI